MPVIDRIKDFQNDLVAIRRDIHAHPEIGFEETRTSAIVADLLETWGITDLAFLMDDDTSDTDARIRAAYLYGSYKPMMSKGIFAGIRMQNAMDAAVLQHYNEAPKRY